MSGRLTRCCPPAAVDVNSSKRELSFPRQVTHEECRVEWMEPALDDGIDQTPKRSDHTRRSEAALENIALEIFRRRTDENGSPVPKIGLSLLEQTPVRQDPVVCLEFHESVIRYPIRSLRHPRICDLPHDPRSRPPDVGFPQREETIPEEIDEEGFKVRIALGDIADAGKRESQVFHESLPGPQIDREPLTRVDRVTQRHSQLPHAASFKAHCRVDRHDGIAESQKGVQIEVRGQPNSGMVPCR